MAAGYHFVSRWRVPGTRDEVRAVLEDAAQLPRWWPSLYREVTVLEPGGPGGVGRVIELQTPPVPYSLRWRLAVTRSYGPAGFTMAATGDFVGTGTWILKQDGDHVVVLYDWRVSAEKPLLKQLSWLLRPVFRANHRLVMHHGEISLRRELELRRMGPEAGAGLPPPPQPTFAWLLPRRGA